MHSPKYSIVIPVYNRPLELDDLLQSLTQQTFRDFEVLVIEDGSAISSEHIFEKYSNQFPITYFYKPNSGPGPSRNFGFEKAKGDYFVVFDSDCQVPPHYFESVEKSLQTTALDAWGGPDRGHEKFTALQQAMAFTMSATLTTGGIRGGKSKDFQPRSFNMGISHEAFRKTGGFHFDRFAEDIELSIRMKKMGLRVGLIPDAFVYHQRRATLSDFFRQVSNFGKGRVLVGRAHRGEVKITHWLPSVFLLGMIALIPMVVIFPRVASFCAVAYALYFIAVAVDCFFATRSTRVALLSIPSAFTQMIGYGSGFLRTCLSHN